ncbi:unnamed protein product [Prunus armeniaca]
MGCRSVAIGRRERDDGRDEEAASVAGPSEEDRFLATEDEEAAPGRGCIGIRGYAGQLAAGEKGGRGRTDSRGPPPSHREEGDRRCPRCDPSAEDAKGAERRRGYRGRPNEHCLPSKGGAVRELLH